MLTTTKFGKSVSTNSSYTGTESTSAVISSQVGRFPDVLTETEVRFMEELLHHQMAACGYVPRRTAASEPAPCLPPLPANARRLWKVRAQIARVRGFQREFAGRSLSFGSAMENTKVENTKVQNT